MIKEFCFGLWAALWVAADELGKKLGEMSAKEFLKLVGKVFVYGLSVICWIFIFFAIYLIGWATL